MRGIEHFADGVRELRPAVHRHFVFKVNLTTVEVVIDVVVLRTWAFVQGNPAEL